MMPSTYEEWKHCITVLCGIPLTPAYIEERLRSLRDPRDMMTARFRELYGQRHLDQIIAWFERAKTEIGSV
jgi:hypothetical protein